MQPLAAQITLTMLVKVVEVFPAQITLAMLIERVDVRFVKFDPDRGNDAETGVIYIVYAVYTAVGVNDPYVGFFPITRRTQPPSEVYERRLIPIGVLTHALRIIGRLFALYVIFKYCIDETVIGGGRFPGTEQENIVLRIFAYIIRCRV